MDECHEEEMLLKRARLSEAVTNPQPLVDPQPKSSTPGYGPVQGNIRQSLSARAPYEGVPAAATEEIDSTEGIPGQLPDSLPPDASPPETLQEIDVTGQGRVINPLPKF